MKRKLLILLVLLGLLLAACSGKGTQESETAGEKKPDAEASNPTEAAPAAELPTETAVILPTDTPEEEEKQPVEFASVSECTLISALPEPPQETIEIFTVNENDWVIGPEDAAVTLIEYGDFQ